MKRFVTIIFLSFVLNSNAFNNNIRANVILNGELKQWHKITLTIDGPFAKEIDVNPNPYTDYRMTVIFTHESGSPVYNIPGYFAADGNASESSATEGDKWRAHLSPDKVGKWTYKVSFLKGSMVAVTNVPWMKKEPLCNGIEGTFEISKSDKTGKDFRSKGRLEYVGKHHLQFKGSKDYFFKVGTDGPETLLGYEDFDNTIALKTKVPLKKYEKHIKDFKEGDPTWQNGKGKGLIGVVNYLSKAGMNSMSFLTYNAGGDGDNVWPFISRDDKFHYDCSKLDQWQIIFDYAQSKGIYLHFKTQETENDDNKHKKKKERVLESLDGGDVGPERRLYYRELIARFGYELALNWNLGEENTQSTENQIAMSNYFNKNDPYHHNVVIHTYPKQQNKIYGKLLGKTSDLTGASLQNEWHDTFKRTLHWINESRLAGKPWVVANDEQGPANGGVPPDPNYTGFDASKIDYNFHDIRKQTLWGNLMAGGAGVEYYYGYKLPENDLLAEDLRSRSKSFDFCRIAVNFLKDYNIPFYDMKNRNDLIDNHDMNKDKFCLAKKNEIYLVYLAYTDATNIDLSEASGKFSVEWFNPKTGEKTIKGKPVRGGYVVLLEKKTSQLGEDWLVIIRK